MLYARITKCPKEIYRLFRSRAVNLPLMNGEYSHNVSQLLSETWVWVCWNWCFENRTIDTETIDIKSSNLYPPTNKSCGLLADIMGSWTPQLCFNVYDTA